MLMQRIARDSQQLFDHLLANSHTEETREIASKQRPLLQPIFRLAIFECRLSCLQNLHHRSPNFQILYGTRFIVKMTVRSGKRLGRHAGRWFAFHASAPL